jgi:hypothetical protein
MKQLLRVIFGCVAVGTLVLASGPAQAQTTGNSPYYAWPAWDQTLACTTITTCPRFIVLSNMNSEAVLDRETGLVWERSQDTTARPWQSAQDHCNQRTVFNRKGWRLPTIQELASLVDPSAPLPPTIPPGHPFSVPLLSNHWSATTSATSANLAWIVGFDSGFVGPSNKALNGHVWCVRGGQGVDPQ